MTSLLLSANGAIDKVAVLRAVRRAVLPYSLYIGDEIGRNHAEYVRRGGKGHPPTRAMILRCLRRLEKDGYLTTARVPRGYYGFEWHITEFGLSLLDADAALGGKR